MFRVSFQELLDTLTRVLVNVGFESERASLCARLFAETTCDGVYTHGLNRFPRFIKAIKNGIVDLHAKPEKISGNGVIERWNGNQGVGNLNAFQCMGRALSITQTHGIGIVALAETNHWMRGGSYGWQAADAGMIGICWTNTLANLPPWGGIDPRLGNTPLVIAVPRSNGHVVLDMSTSQFSYGAMELRRLHGELLPVDGGFDAAGKLTKDPVAILETRRPLPIGYWKGSGLSLMLDLLAAILSGGLAVCEIAQDPDQETRLSQIFIAVDPTSVGQNGVAAQVADHAIEFMKSSTPVGEEQIRYPGEKVLQTRKENMEQGIPVEPAIWEQVKTWAVTT
jgi:3-dehydro-L-gulonate 2-dehydrogenase